MMEGRLLSLPVGGLAGGRVDPQRTNPNPIHNRWWLPDLYINRSVWEGQDNV